jgi:hypothetical protein
MDLLQWQVPEGEWSIQLFPLMIGDFHKKYLRVDYMDTTAVRHMINETYEKYKERFGKYFGNTIKTTFSTMWVFGDIHAIGQLRLIKNSKT